MKAILPLLAVIVSCVASLPAADWKTELATEAARLGHRNMIVVADSAYPIQTGAGVKVIATNAPHLEVVDAVTKAIDAAPGVAGLPALDKEFRHLPEKHAPGAAKLRRTILGILGDKKPVREELHATLLKEVNETAGEYVVVVFKTTGTTPYSSVFFTLDCGYWSPEAEAELRKKMK